MKKFRSIAIILCLMLSCCMLFSSCMATEFSVENNPAKALSEALNNTYADFFGDGIGFYELLENAGDKTAVELSLEGEDILGDELTYVGATVYSNKKTNQYVIDASASYGRETIEATVFADENGIIANSEDIFDSTDNYGFFFDTFIRKFEKSDLCEGMGIDGETAEQIVDIVEELQEKMEQSNKENTKDAQELINDICVIFEQTVETAKAEIDGKEKTCVIVTYTVSNKNLEEAIYRLYDEYGRENDRTGEIEASVVEMVEELNEECKIDLTVTSNILLLQNKVASIVVDGTVTTYSYPDSYYDSYTGEYIQGSKSADKTNVAAEVVFTDEEINITVAVKNKQSDVNVSVEAVIAKQVKNKNVTYTVKADAVMGSVSAHIIDAEILFKKDGTFSVEAEIFEDEASTYDISVDGTYDVSKSDAEFVIESVTTPDEKYRMNIRFAFDIKPNMPKFPKDTEDLIDYSESEWEKLGRQMENSRFAELIEKIY